MGEEKRGKYVLEDLSRHPIEGFCTNTVLNKELIDAGMGPWAGHTWILMPMDQYSLLDFTAKPGDTSGLYYSLAFQLPKWEYVLQKADEWVEVSPIHAQYYQITLKQKEELEGKIKAGLASAGQAVADLELIKHDERKYREFLNYFGWEYKDGKWTPTKKKDDLALRSVFIDQVDVHTGDIAIRQIVQRWPTLIIDFMKLTDEDIDADKLKKKLVISKAEAVVLVAKNKLFLNWKQMFGPEVKTRYERISELVRSRETSIKEYREWLTPIIARHKMLGEGLSRPEKRMDMLTSFIHSAGHATSSSEIVLWAWRELVSPEFYRGGTELIAKEIAAGKFPYDDWTKKNMIFGKKHGLINKYPWLTDKWVKEQLEFFRNNRWYFPDKLYYSFFEIRYIKTNIRSASGNETEDGMFFVNSVFLSQNALFVKMLELRAKQEELNQYINRLLGIGSEIKGDSAIEQKSIFDSVKGFLNYFSIPMSLIKRGPYEHDFDERITKSYLVPQGAERYHPIINLLKTNMGLGVK
ncbi:MAG: hypothetical protein V1802_02710 [Candidatus Aenigmatarchaeota archaeon]